MAACISQIAARIEAFDPRLTDVARMQAFIEAVQCGNLRNWDTRVADLGCWITPEAFPLVNALLPAELSEAEQEGLIEALGDEEMQDRIGDAITVLEPTAEEVQVIIAAMQRLLDAVDRLN